MLTGAAMIALMAALVYGANKAHAEPPKQGSYDMVTFPAIVCDTKENIQTIAKAGVDDGKKMQAAFEALVAMKDEKGEPTCTIAPPAGPFAFGENEPLGVLHTQDDTLVDAWAVHLGNENGDWWIIWAEKSKQTSL